MAVRGFQINDPKVQQIIGEYNLCKEFGWTLNELYRQPANRIGYFAAIISEKNKIAKEEDNRRKFQAQQQKWRRK